MSASSPTASAPGGIALRQRVSSILGSRWILFILSLTLLLTVWQIFGPSQPLFASYPSAIAAAAVQSFIPDMLPAWWATLVGYSVGLMISAPLAQVIGVAMGRSRFIDLLLSPYVNALYVTPRIALIPVLVLWFGLDFYLRVSIVVLSSIFPMIINTYTGMRQVSEELLEVGTVFTANPRQRLFTIVVPASMPYVFTGLRLGTARALGGIIVAEMTASFTGIGQRLINYGTFFEIDRLFVGVVSIGVFGLLLARAVVVAQARVAPWTQAVRTQ